MFDGSFCRGVDTQLRRTVGAQQPGEQLQLPRQLRLLQLQPRLAGQQLAVALLQLSAAPPEGVVVGRHLVHPALQLVQVLLLLAAALLR